MSLNLTSPRPGGGNLTGSARTLNDVVVTFYSTIQKWKSCLIDGIALIQDMQAQLDNADVVEKKCEDMGKLIATMNTLVNSMKDSESKIQSLSLLNKSGTSPCLSWPYSKIVECMKTVCVAYEKEMEFRSQIVSSLQTRTLSQLNIIAVFWVHCGQVDSHIEANLEALLRECWLK